MCCSRGSPFSAGAIFFACSLSIILRADAAVAAGDEDNAGVILDYDEDGNLISLEVLDAPKPVTEAHRIDFETVG